MLSAVRRYGLPELNRRAWQRYAVGLIAAAAGAGASIVLRSFAGVSAPWLVAFLPVIATAWYGGLGPSLVAAAGGAAAVLWWFVPSPRWGHIASDAAAPLGAYVLVSVAVALMVAAYRRRLKGVHEQLSSYEQRNDELQLSLNVAQSKCETLRKDLGEEAERNRKLGAELEATQQQIGVAEAAARLRVFDWDLRANAIELSGDASIFGLCPETWHGYESWMSAVHPNDRAMVEREVARSLESREAMNIAFRVSRPDGSEHWLAVKSDVICGAQNEPIRVAGVFVDITEQKTTEEALLRNEKLAAAARLAATMAHEVNNPLTAITNLLYIIKGDKTLSRAGAQYLQLAQEELSRVSRLAQQSLGFYKEQVTASTFSVPELLDEVLALYARNMPANIKVEKRYGGSVEVRGVRGEIWQVFANAISNAIYALSEGGTLTIEANKATRPDSAGMLVRISDTGPGISPENLKKVFQPFFTTKQKLGTGLGLWIAKDLISKHSGSIDIESRVGEKDHGTSIVVFLPAAAERIVAAGGDGESKCA